MMIIPIKSGPKEPWNPQTSESVVTRTHRPRPSCESVNPNLNSPKPKLGPLGSQKVGSSGGALLKEFQDMGVSEI